jgi:amino acid exporter
MQQLAPSWVGIITAYGIMMLGLMSPGPNILSVIGTSMSVGRRPGVMLALGVSAGSVLWGTLTGIGLTALLAAYTALLVAIKIAGGCYLLWLALKAFRSAASPREIKSAAPSESPHPLRYFLRGLSVQMSNPKAALAWIAIITLGVQPDAPWCVTAAIVAGSGLLSLAGHLLYALLFSTARIDRFYRRARRWIELALGAFFGFAGVKLLTSRV